jgi:hypothetical protein
MSPSIELDVSSKMAICILGSADAARTFGAGDAANVVDAMPHRQPTTPPRAIMERSKERVALLKRVTAVLDLF